MILAIQLELIGMKSYFEGGVPRDCGLCNQGLQRAFFSGLVLLHDPIKGTHHELDLITCIACGLKVGKEMKMYRLPTMELVEECSFKLAKEDQVLSSVSLPSPSSNLLRLLSSQLGLED